MTVMGLCVYCAMPCDGLACWAHRDLLRVDPAYAPHVPQRPAPVEERIKVTKRGGHCV